MSQQTEAVAALLLTLERPGSPPLPDPALSDNVSETTTPVKFTVEGDGVVSHVSFYQS